MKDIENNSGNVFDEITVVESSNLNIITSNSLSLFGNAGQVLIRASPSTVNYTMTLPNAIGTAGQLLSTDGSGNAYWVTAGGGGGGTGTVTSVSLTVPSILSVSGSPVTSSGTLAITTATTPTGSGAIVLKTQPTIQNPTITNSNDGSTFIGINALDPTVPSDYAYQQLFGRDTSDPRNYLSLSTSSDTIYKNANLSIGSLFLDFNHIINTTTREILLFVDTNSKVVLSRNDTTGVSTLQLISDVLRLPQSFSDATKTSLLTTTRVSGQANIAAIPAGTTGQVLTVQGGGSLGFSTPASGSVTSVGLTVPSILSVSGSPITTSGTLEITTATTPTGTGAIVLSSKPSIVNLTVTSVFEDSAFGEEYVGINALSANVLDSGYSNDHYFGINRDVGYYIKLSTRNDGANTFNTINAGDNYLNFLKVGTFESLKFTQNIPSNYFEFGTDFMTAQSTVSFICENVSLKDVFSDATKPSLLITNRSAGFSNLSILTAGTTGQVLTTQPDGSLAFSTPASGGTVTSVSLTVPSILSVSGSPITTSGTLAITTATTPTGSGAIVLKTQPTIQNPTITNSNDGSTFIGINAIDPTVPSTSTYQHLFGRDTSDPRNYLSIATSSDTSIKDASITLDSIYLELVHVLVSNSRYMNSFVDNNAKIFLSRNDTTTVSTLELISDVVNLAPDFSDATKPSVLITNRVSSLSKISKVTAGTTSQALSVQSDGSLAFSAPGPTTQAVTAKAKSTIYQNTTSKPVFVSIVYTVAVLNETITIQCDTVTPPVIKISESTYNSNSYNFFFIVLPGYYYRITSSNAGDVQYWVEWN